MASLYNNKISTTYVGLIKTIDNAVISASLRELTDGSGNATGLHLNNAGDFKAYSTDEAKPELADIVCKRRGSSDATYGDVHAGDTLHCDVVTSIDNNTLTTIGGNIDNKVKRTTLSLSEDGYLNEDGYFVIIKNK